MIYTIRNEKLKTEINSYGAELHSIQTLDGCEYLWQGDPAVWNGPAPNLFPYVARLTDQKYTFEGKEYTVTIPAGAAENNDIPWYGPLYLQMRYGK